MPISRHRADVADPTTVAQTPDRPSVVRTTGGTDADPAAGPDGLTTPTSERAGGRRRRSSTWRAFQIATVLAVWSISGRSAPVMAAPCWEPPVDAAVSDPYRRPPCKWCPGNRGIEFDTGPGEPVHAVAAGTVTFAGPVAGTWFVVVLHGDGLRTTYGNVTDLTVSAGSSVVGGMRIATTAGRLHFGVRDGDEYLDPTPFLGEWVGRPRLIPVDGSPPRPAPPPRLSCVSG